MVSCRAASPARQLSLSTHKLGGVIDDQTLAELHERNTARFLAARQQLGEMYVCHTPINQRKEQQQ